MSAQTNENENQANGERLLLFISTIFFNAANITFEIN
jgi:hypothetical protein